MLLDDPFSALDAKVTREVFAKVVNGLLRGHAVVMVTHQKSFAAECTTVLALDADGRQRRSRTESLRWGRTCRAHLWRRGAV